MYLPTPGNRNNSSSLSGIRHSWRLQTSNMSFLSQTALLIKPKFKNIFQNHRTTKSEEYLPKIIHKITASPKIKGRLLKHQKTEFEYEKSLLTESRLILDKIADVNRGGRNPYILAVATIYAADQKLSKKWKKKSILTQHLLSIITGTAEYSVRDHWRGLLYNYVN